MNEWIYEELTESEKQNIADYMVNACISPSASHGSFCQKSSMSKFCIDTKAPELIEFYKNLSMQLIDSFEQFEKYAKAEFDRINGTGSLSVTSTYYAGPLLFRFLYAFYKLKTNKHCCSGTFIDGAIDTLDEMIDEAEHKYI